MSLDHTAQNNAGNTPSSNNAGNNKMTTNPLFGLLGSSNLFASTHNINEVKEIQKSLEDTIKYMQKNTASEAQKLSLPSLVQNITTDISAQLPGLTLSTVIGPVRYVMPILFFKTGVTEATEVIMLANENMPRGIAKVAASFMNNELMEKVKSSSAYHEGKTIPNVVIVAPSVINLETVIKNSVKPEDVIVEVRNTILKEWNTSLYNLVVLEVTKAGVEMPNPFKEGKMFGKDDAAVARIEPVNKAIIDGKPVPYNLAVKLSTTNKNNTQNLNSNNTRSVITSYLNVSLETMSPPQFLQAKQAKPGANVGPLVPVISTGLTVPGETLNNNNSMLTTLLGLYASIGANQMQFFSEAFRGKEVGYRGNLGNFNHYLTTMLGSQFYPTQSYLTDKNLTNAAIVNEWLGRYVAPNAVYVLDLASFTEDVSNSDFWWNIIAKPHGSTYHKALINLLDVLSNNAFSKVLTENATKQQRDARRDWISTDPILKATPIMMPTGIARGKDGKWFDLAEVDGMFLRQENYYGQNEAAVNEYLGLINGSTGGDPKVRQFNIYNRLNQLFDTNVIIDGWKRRFVWEDAFFNTFARAMSTSGVLSMSASNMASMWTMQHSNDYLTQTISAVIQQGLQGGSMGGFNGSFTHYQ